MEDLPKIIDDIHGIRDPNNEGVYTVAGWNMAESSYKENVKQYLDRLDEVQRLSFAPIDALVHSSKGGIDL